MNHANDTKVWDPLVRIFHWSLVATFAIAYLSGEGEDEWLSLHSIAGYTIMGLILVRLIWGVIGTPYARFSSFIYRPSAVVAYLKQLLLLRPPRYLGHNPAGSVMIIALLVSLVLTSVSGLVIYGAEENAGPLAGMLAGTSESQAHALGEVHEFFANLTLFLVVFHVVGVVVSSVLHHENLVRAMVTGYKRTEE